MSFQTIEMHFAEVTKLSEQLSGLAKTLKVSCGEEIMGIAAAGRTKWNSKCADILVEKEVRLGMQLISEAEVLMKIAEELKQRAEKMYWTEVMNNHLAATRIYF